VARAAYAPHLPVITSEEAGRHLGSLLESHDLVLYETFLPDLAGHRRLPWPPERVLQRIDGLLRGVLEASPPETTILITSDHGNFEDSASRAHTYNPVPLIVAGPAAPYFTPVADLTGVTPAILRALQH
jgi:2,3-bisphosphoglycerate-independent phosphoglycerate mutase